VRCPLTPDRWQAYCDTGDTQVAQHLTSCPACRAEAERLRSLTALLGSLPTQEAPAAVRREMAALDSATAGRTLSCAEALDLLEPYREGALNAARAFLVADHLLWCRACSLALAQAEAVSEALWTLPSVAVPDAVAERVAIGRLPWWQRLLPTPVFPRVAWTFTALAAMLLGYAGLRVGPAIMVAIYQPTPQVQPAPAPQPEVAVTPKPSPRVRVARPVIAPINPVPVVHQAPTPRPHALRPHVSPITPPKPPVKPPVTPPKLPVVIPHDTTPIPVDPGSVELASYHSSAQAGMELATQLRSLEDAENEAERSVDKIAALHPVPSTSGV
jgi:hypothetical protein